MVLQRNLESHNLTITDRLSITSTITPGGTYGNQTINTPAGTVNFNTGVTALTVTSSIVTATSIIYAVMMTDDSGGTGIGNASIWSVVPSSGSFVINLFGPPLTPVTVGFIVFN